MKKYIFIGLLSIMGCNNLKRLEGVSGSRDNGYDTEPVSGHPRIEPYAVFAGYQPNGGRLYLIHWQGNVLNNVSLPEQTVDGLNIRKYAI